MDLTDVIEEQVQWAVGRLNHRPRKVLGFRTPHEIFFGLSVNYTKSPEKVALQI
jgi:IS30 family transposase